MLKTRRRTCNAVLMLVLCSAVAGFAQSEATVSVTGDVPKALVLSAADLAKLPRATVAMTNSGVVTSFEGVLLSEVLKSAGHAPGADLSGYVLANGADGYQAVFSLGELDPSVTEARVLLADKANGKPLTGRDGPLRLVAPQDIRGVRAVRNLTRLTIVLLTPRGDR